MKGLSGELSPSHFQEKKAEHSETFVERAQKRFGPSFISHLVKDGKLRDQQAANLVRAYLFDTVTEETRKFRIDEISHLLGLSKPQIVSAFAWIKYGDRKKKSYSEVSIEDRMEIIFMLQSASCVFERMILVFEIREAYGVTTEAIREIATLANIRLTDLASAGPTPVPTRTPAVPAAEPAPVPAPEKPKESLPLSEEDLSDVLWYLRSWDSYSSEEKTYLQEEIKKEYGVSDEQFQHLLTRLSERTEEEVTVGEDIRGDGVSYDNPLKERWRKIWMNYVTKNLNPEQRGKAKVLCLPGKDCLEIPHYLKAGFRPENIVGVEGGRPHVQQAFLQRAQQLGIQTRVGRLEDIVPSEEQQFDVVSLDFHGQISATKLAIFSHLPLAEHAIVLLNLMAKREDGHIQQSLRELDARQQAHSTVSEINLLRTVLGGHEALVDELNQKYLRVIERSNGILSEKRTITELRNGGYHDIFSDKVGVDREDKWPYPEELKKLAHSPFDKQTPDWVKKRRSPGEQIRDGVRMAIAQLIDQKALGLYEYNFNPSLCRQSEKIFYSSIEAHISPELYGFLRQTSFANHENEKAMVFAPLFTMLEELSTVRSVITDLEKYRYASVSGKGTSDFFTDLMVIHTPHDLAAACRETVLFLLKMAYAQNIATWSGLDVMMFRDKIGKNPPTMVAKDPEDQTYSDPTPPVISAQDLFKKPVRGRELKGSDRFILKKSQMVIATITLHRILADILRFTEQYDLGLIYSKQERINGFRKLPRTMIE